MARVMRRDICCGLFALLGVSSCSVLTSLDGLAGHATADVSSSEAATSPDAQGPDGEPPMIDASGGDANGCGSPGPTNGLLLYYPFDEGTGNTAHDCSSNHLDGTFVRQGPGGSWRPGHRGNAIKVAQGSGCMDVGMPAQLQPQVMTISAWVNITSFPVAPSSGYVIGQTLNANTNGWRLASQMVDAGTFIDWLSSANGDQNNVDVPAPPLSTWHHLAVAFDPATQLEMFVDGISTTTRMKQPAIVYTVASLRIGCRADDVNYFNGLIDEVRMYDRVLALDEIKQLAVP